MRLIVLVRAGTTKEQNDMDELLNAAYSCWVSKPRRGYIGYSRSVSVAVSLVVRFCQYFQLGTLAIVFFGLKRRCIAADVFRGLFVSYQRTVLSFLSVVFIS